MIPRIAVVSLLFVIGCTGQKAVEPIVTPIRVVSTSPAVTEIIFALGAGDHLVGVTTYCDYPEEAKAKPKVGEFMPATISIETIVAMKPDYVFIDGGVQRPLKESLAKVGVTATDVKIESIDGMKFEIDRIAHLLKKSPTALLDSLKDRERDVAKRVSDKARPTVFVMIGGATLFTVGPNTVIHEIVTLAGGRNIFEDAKQPYLSVSDEELLKRDPDVIIVPRAKDVEAQKRDLLAKPGWTNLKAVKARRLYFVNEDTLSRSGPRYVDALNEIALLLHPKAP